MNYRHIAGQRWAVLGLVLMALCVRLVFVLWVRPDMFFGDQAEYLSGAQRLLAGQPLAVKNWMMFVRAPGYSLFIALCWALAGTQSEAVVRVAQAILGTGTCYYVYLMASDLGGRYNRGGALLALLWAALYPYSIYFTSSLGSETLFSFLFAAGMYHLGRGLRPAGPDLRQVVLAAFVLSLGNLVRVNLTVMLPLIGCWLWWRFRRRPGLVLRLGLALSLPLLCVTLPWTWSVYRQGLGLIWVTDGGGANFLVGNSPEAAQLYCDRLTPAEELEINKFPGEERFGRRPEFLAARALPPRQQAGALFRAALGWDLQHLRRMPCLIGGKVLHYWKPWVNPVTYGRQAVLLSLAAAPVLLLGAIGLLLAWREGERSLTVLALLQAASGTITSACFSAEIRYRVPAMDVLLLAFAGFALCRICVQWARNYHDTKTSVLGW